MAIYEYRNGRNETREIVAPMTAPPPACVTIFSDGSWMDPTVPMTFDHDDPRYAELKAMATDQRVFRRVYGVGGVHITNLAVKPGKDGLPVSHASPRRKGGKPVKIGNHTLLEHKDGGLTNTNGQPIIDSNNAARDNAKRTGTELD